MEPIVLTNVKGDGDCFFYSIYEALKDQRLFDTLNTITNTISGIVPLDEANFVSYMRNFIADQLDRSSGKLNNYYKFFVEAGLKSMNKTEQTNYANLYQRQP